MKQFETFGKYLLLERLAAGGMAEVYLAKSTGAGGVAKFVAIKRILPQYSDNPEFMEMFKEEAKIAVNLNHGNVVSIFEFGVENHQFFLVMEYVEGQNLRQILNHLKKESKEFSIDQIVYVIKQVAAGLDHAHRCIDGTTGRPLNITHRDMSPQNVMISFEGEVKVVDFGIAKAESQVDNTRAGTIKGKFGYMSPEQAEGQNVDLRTDIFSLGICLWELLAKDRLFTSNSEASTLRKIRECQIPSLRRINPAIPPELERICNKALAKDKSLRYQTSAALHKDLNRFLNTQYPEFSAQDFSIFMKSAFSQMFIENRKKQVEYAKAQNVPYDEGTVITKTATLTDTNTEEKAGTATIEDFFGVDATNFAKIRKGGGLDLAEMKTKPRPLDKFHSSFNTWDKKRMGTNPRMKAPEKEKFKLAPWMIYLPILVFGGGGTYMWLEKHPVKIDYKALYADSVSTVDNLIPQTANPPRPPQKVEQGDEVFASKQKVVVTIQSYPKSARVYIDGQDTGAYTPYRRQIEVNKEFRLGLVSEGFTYYEKIEKVSQDGTSIRATLQPLPPMGYVSINVLNPGNDPVVYVNGQRINQKPPINLLGITANKPVRIRVANPFTQLSDEKVVTVGANEKKPIEFFLKPENKK